MSSCCFKTTLHMPFPTLASSISARSVLYFQISSVSVQITVLHDNSSSTKIGHLQLTFYIFFFFSSPSHEFRFGWRNSIIQCCCIYQTSLSLNNLTVWQISKDTHMRCPKSTFDTKNPHVLAQRKDGHRGKCSALLTFTAVSHNLCIVDCYIWDKHLMLDVLVYSEENKKTQDKKKDMKQPKIVLGLIMFITKRR